MKKETKKKTTLLKDIVVTVNPDLDEFFGDRIFFPEKLAEANDMLAKYPLPDHLKSRKDL